MKYYAFSIFQDCKDWNRFAVCLCLSNQSAWPYSMRVYINPNASRINIQNTCTYICKRNTIVNGDKNGAHVAATTTTTKKETKKKTKKHRRFIIEVSKRIEHVWFMFRNDNFNAEIYALLVVMNRTYIAQYIINTREKWIKGSLSLQGGFPPVNKYRTQLRERLFHYLQTLQIEKETC